ncbi:hypothetical protein M9H77_14697 [Catharanthus roseus]|uniref:Uncharacterized protein n=1 Tax=Catharanthus roseus TaxID=4058 RepID=A0ACC0BNX9_CATRO|nr:hypothetical protein M9H77_14697 [Catharanthus roseus]
MSEAADDDGGAERRTVVVVAVKSAGGRGSRRAVRWSAKKLMWKADRFLLLHIMPTVTVIPTPSGESIPIEDVDAKVVQIYRDDMREKSQEIFIPFMRLLKRKKIETLVLEGDNPASTLVKYISELGISTLVLGSCFSKVTCFGRKPKSTEVPSTVLKNAPHTCTVYVVSRHGIITNTPFSMATGNSFKEVLLSKRECEYHTTSKQPSHTHSSLKEARGHKKFGSSTSSDLISLDSRTSLLDNPYNESSVWEGKRENVGSTPPDIINVQDWCSQTSGCTEQVNAISHLLAYMHAFK